MIRKVEKKLISARCRSKESSIVNHFYKLFMSALFTNKKKTIFIWKYPKNIS